MPILVLTKMPFVYKYAYSNAYRNIFSDLLERNKTHDYTNPVQFDVTTTLMSVVATKMPILMLI